MNVYYLGTNFQIEERYLTNLDFEKVQKLEPDDFLKNIYD